MESNVTSGNTTEYNAAVLLAHTARLVQRPFQVTLQQPNLPRASQRRQNHNTLCANVTINVSCPQEVPLMLVSETNSCAVDNRAQVQWNSRENENNLLLIADLQVYVLTDL